LELHGFFWLAIKAAQNFAQNIKYVFARYYDSEVVEKKWTHIFS
jgi:hypothetical protein